MRDNYKNCLDCVLKHEGGWSDHPSDPGGATMKGITLRVYKAYYGQHKTKEDLKIISPVEISTIYKRGYWDKCWGDKLPKGVDYAVFDFAVNSGPRRAVRYLQYVVQSDPDGLMGPNTLSQVFNYDSEYIIKNLYEKRLSYLKLLNTWKVFGKGWSNRLNEGLSISLGMIDE